MNLHRIDYTSTPFMGMMKKQISLKIFYPTHQFPPFPGNSVETPKILLLQERFSPLIMDPKPVTENRFLPRWFDEDAKTKIFAFEPHFDL